jgi:RHS repeat-associated protein
MTGGDPRPRWYNPTAPGADPPRGQRDQTGPQPGIQGPTTAPAAPRGAPSGQAATAAASPADTAGSLPSISLPTGGGAIRGIDEKLSVNQATGTAALTVGVFTSPARQGFGPSVGLSYDSGAGNGPFGLGWSLGVAAITRKTSKGLPLYQDAIDSDVFMLSGAEDLVPLLNADGTAPALGSGSFGGKTFTVRAYRPRVESGFARIERWTDTASADVHWRTITADNVTSLYGQDPSSRIADPADPSRIFSWLLDRSFDSRGNAAQYLYKAEDSGKVTATVSEAHRVVTANRYLKEVRYGNDTPYLPATEQYSALPTDWCFRLVLDYGEHDLTTPTPNPAAGATWACRPDPFSTYRSGFEIRTYRLCRRLLMFHQISELSGTPPGQPPPPVLVRSTDLTYQAPPIDLTLPVLSLLGSVTHTGWITAPTGGYQPPASLPAMQFEYSPLAPNDTLHTLRGTEAANLVGIFDGNSQRWVDLDGEGLQGILTKDDGAWYYQHNVSAWNPDPAGSAATARFDPIAAVATRPSSGASTLTDLNGTGQLCAVDFTEPSPGWFEYDPDTGWSPLRLLSRTANIDFNDPNLRFVDLNGDGLSDVLITEDDVITWYEWNLDEGFGPAGWVPKPVDEDQGPAVVLADGAESIHLADMTGDGLTDLVRVRNGEICYWPNLGYGRFGAKITMNNAPLFDYADVFAAQRIQFADIDGSGTADIAYLGARPTIWFNQSGNSWTAARQLTQFPNTPSGVRSSVFDLLGTGTACAVWTSPLPDDAGAPLRYIDVTGGVKPYLLTTVTNNVGAQKTLTYAPSTKFYLHDRALGTPWLTRLPFPVHVVEQMRIDDAITRTSYTNTYSYHHGYFDGVEREFRGFARVDSFDTDTMPADSGIGTSAGTFTSTPPIDGETFDLPTVKTQTWYHTGAYIDGADLAAHLADEYWQGDPQARHLQPTLLPAGLGSEDLREACRALRGKILHQEVYALDGSPIAANPYTTANYRYEVDQLQPSIASPTGAADPLQYGAFHPWQREALSGHYERNPADPRISHDLTLTIDDYGNITSSASVGYPRRNPAFDEQSTTWVSYTQTDYTNMVDQPDWYRIGVTIETRGYQLTGAEPDPASELFDPDGPTGLAAIAASAAAIPFDANPSSAVPAPPQRRLLTRKRIYYHPDDLSAGPLPVTLQSDGSVTCPNIGSLALVYATYTQRYTTTLLTNVFGAKYAGAVPNTLTADGAYVDLDGNGNLWAPSSQLFYSPDPAHPDASYAQTHFFQPVGAIDPWGNTSSVAYDDHNLLVTQTTDPVGNTTAAQHNYRVLAPWLITDPNQNRAGVRFDALGMITATAVMGKLLPDGSDEGDHLDTTTTEAAAGDDPTTTLNYDLAAYQNWAAAPNPDPDHPTPAWVHTRARVDHKIANTAWIESYTYTDGLGRVALTKAQAEPGSAPQRDPTTGQLVRNPDSTGAAALTFAPTDDRWVGTGRVVYDNKGNPVKAYEPFFDSSHTYDDETDLVDWGVTAITRYDPLGRAIRVDNPNGTYRTIEFDPWQTITSDENDTVLGPPAGSPSAWYTARINNQLGPDEAQAANKAAAHARTPTITNADTLGRVFQTVANNGPNATDQYATTLTLDIQGRTLATQDALQRTVLTQDYDMTGAEIHHNSVDAGERWLLTDVGSQLMQAWDNRDYTVTATYDPLRRPTTLHVTDPNGNTRTAEQMAYGETLDTTATSTAAEDANLRGALYQHYDAAGLATTTQRDFKCNTLTTTRQLLTDYTGDVDWSTNPALATETLPAANTYDALNRITTSTAPDGTITTPTYNQRSLLATAIVALKTGQSTDVVTSASYDAKGQRQTANYGNGATTTYTYDPDTFRLIHINTRRTSSSDSVSSQIFNSPNVVQDIQYTYDPVGNITHTDDAALTTIFYGNQQCAPTCDYTYDPLYRLTETSGREHIGQNVPQPTWNDLARIQVLPSDVAAMQTYTENYDYDSVGNFQTVTHTAASGSWSRTYAYDEPQQPARNNQLTSTTVGATTEHYSYDAAGNMGMPHLPTMQWDFQDQLEATAQQVTTSGTAPTTYYRYDAGGQRVLKATFGQLNSKTAQRVYLGGYELYREYDTVGTITLERHSVHITAGGNRLCLVETTTIDTNATTATPSTLARYQFGNNLGSTAVELDAAASLITYEEYYPYGATSLQTGANQAEVSLKRYRYTGKERDAETGFTYHRARYYAPWLGRWIRPDPAGLAGGINAYVYAANSPARLIDHDGRQPLTPFPEQQAWIASQSASSQSNSPQVSDPGAFQTWLSDRLTQRVTATRSTPGFDKTLNRDMTKASDAFGPGGGTDVLHPADRPFALQMAGEESDVSGGPSSLNRSLGVTRDKPLVDAARAANQPTRVDGVDVNAPKGVRAQRPPRAPWRGSISEWKGSVPKDKAVTPFPDAAAADVPKPVAPPTIAPPPVAPPAADPKAPSTVAPPSGSAPAGAAGEASAWEKFSARAASAGNTALKIAGLVATVTGALNEGGKTMDMEVAQGVSRPIAALAATETMVVAAAAGFVDDAQLLENSGFVQNSWETAGAGPAQHTAGEVMRSIFQWGNSLGF